VYSADRKFSYETKYCRAFFCTNFRETPDHWTYIYIYIYIYILQIVKMCLDPLPNTVKGVENTEEIQLLSEEMLLHHSAGCSANTDFCPKNVYKQHAYRMSCKSEKTTQPVAQVTDGRTAGRNEVVCRYYCLLYCVRSAWRALHSAVQLCMTSLTFCNIITHDEPYVLQYNYAWRALRSAI
jgi:hypothetical protein